MYSQSSDRVFTDGVLTSQSACSDDLHTYQIKFNAIGCTDEVDSGGGNAYDRAKPYYINVSGTYLEVGSCQRYENRLHKITATEVGCTHDVDTSAGVSRIRTRRVYTSAADVVTEVSGCTASGTTAPLQWTSGGCDIRHDVGAGRSYQQMRRFYVYNGAEYPVGACEDHGYTYAHTRTDAGCPVIQNDQTHQVITYKRTVVSVPAGISTVVDCAPDQTVGMTADRAACAGQFSHIPSSSVSYGLVRYTYSLNGALQASDCVVDPALVYAHEDAMGAWVHNDAARASLQSIITYINTPQGRVVVSTRNGPWISDYAATGNETRPEIGSTTYNGCTRNIPSTIYTTYTRTDGTSVTLANGAGPVTSSADGCSPLAEALEVLRVFEVKDSSAADACYTNWKKFQTQRTAQRRQNGAGEIFQDPWIETTVLLETRVDELGGCMK